MIRAVKRTVIPCALHREAVGASFVIPETPKVLSGIVTSTRPFKIPCLRRSILCFTAHGMTTRAQRHSMPQCARDDESFGAVWR
jgi:hypothetical protein